MKNHILGNRIARSVLLVVSLGLLLLEDSVCSVQRAEPLLVPAAAHPKAADPAAHPVTTASLTTVGGVVQDKYTREPIGNALVRVSSPAIQMRSVRGPLPGIIDTRTDRLGRFEVQVPSNEMISVNALAPGYEEAAGPWMNREQRFHQVTLSSAAANKLTIELQPALYIAGRVVDQSGNPISDVRIEATMRSDRGYSYVEFDHTDSTGRFELFDFPIQPFDLEGGTNGHGHLTFDHIATLRTNLRDVYSLSKAERAELRIQLVSGHKITGTLTSANGAPVGSTLVETIPANDTVARKSCVTDKLGRFKLWGVQGDVTLVAHALTLKQKVRREVTVRAVDENVHLRLEPVVYQYPRKGGTNTQSLRLTDKDLRELKQLARTLNLPLNTK